jgi:NRAMP (natural resistance-associated macrophage protein)-like metal ion transporter
MSISAEQRERKGGLGNFFKKLGPGLVTGAADDDPSGIATYSQAGARFGMATLWTALVTFPLMSCIQEMCARIGLVTGKGLTFILKKHYPKGILYLVVLLSIPATILNIGSDIAGMGAVCHLLWPAVPAYAFCVAFTILMIVVIIRFSYKKIASILKWLCLSMFLYIIVPFLIHPNWKQILHHTVVPTIHFNKDFILMLVAILGTTISPYLFFWQTTMEAEEKKHDGSKVIVDKQALIDMRQDVNIGMVTSNVVMYFITLTAAVVLYGHIKNLETVEQAAKALQPLAGNLSYLLFAMGILGTGFLTIPVLAGSLSYITAESFGWKAGLDKNFYQAKGFYATILVSLAVGLLITFLGFSPMKALVYTGVLYGLIAPILIAVILHICNNKRIMKDHTNKWLSNVIGMLTFVLMSVAAVALIWLSF